MPTAQKFEAVKVWQLACELSQRIYPLLFSDPIAKDFRFKDQIREAGGALTDKGAEGFERGSKPAFISAFTIAKSETSGFKSQL